MTHLQSITKNSFVSIGLVIVFLVVAVLGTEKITELRLNVKAHEQLMSHPGAVTKEMIEVQLEMINIKLGNIEKRLENLEKR